VATPYLWSYSDHYDKGKFVADGKYNPDAVSKQVGAAILLKELM
jgi:lysozyme family protein